MAEVRWDSRSVGLDLNATPRSLDSDRDGESPRESARAPEIPRQFARVHRESADTPGVTLPLTTATATPVYVTGRHALLASSRAGTRLGRALLGYVAGIIAIITLAPFRFETHPVHGLTDLWTPLDIVMNVVMFVPLGFLYRLTWPESSRGRAPGASGALLMASHAFALGAVTSAAIEIAQLFERTRYTSLLDVLTNASGALIGALLHDLVARQVRADRAVKTMALELPLMGLVYLLAPMMWLAGLSSAGVGDDTRAPLVLFITAVAGGILGTVHGAYLAPLRGRTRGWLALTALAWFAIATVPSGIRDVPLVMTGALLTVCVAWLRSIATARTRETTPGGENRRFELPTLRLLLPCFAAYLALSSLWPLDGAEPTFVASIPLLPSGVDTTQEKLFAILEHVGAFTLVGYVTAEFYGRDVQRFRDMAGRVVLWGGGVSLLLELARGWHPFYRASVSLWILTVLASGFGGWIYQLQREHVRTLISLGASPKLQRDRSYTPRSA